MSQTQPQLLIAAVAAVGVLHTMVPDHWLPISLYARSANWSKGQVARAAAGAGLGHTLSTLALGLIMWFVGALAAQRYGHLVSFVSSLALIAFGLWVALSGYRELRGRDDARAHAHEHVHADKPSQRLTLLLILGSSPMVEGLPAFFAAGQYGAPLLLGMSLVFAVATISTYIALCVGSLAGLQQLRLSALERYGELLSGAIIAALGAVFLFY